jgi:hypothetical protein
MEAAYMGGYGSGRPGTRPVAEQSLALRLRSLQPAIRALAQDATPGRTAYIDNRLVWTSGMGYYVASTRYRLYCYGSPDHMTLQLLYSHNKQPIHDVLGIVTTPCNFGGVRYWFWCECGRRVGVLFAPGRYWRCRHCYSITYQSSNDSDPRVARLLRDPAAFLAMAGRDKGDPIGLYKKTSAELVVLLKAYGKLGRF